MSSTYQELLRRNRESLAVFLETPESTVSLARLENRLLSERKLSQNGLYDTPGCDSLASLIVLVDEAPGASLESTLLSWSLQSGPVHTFIVPRGVTAAAAAEWLRERRWAARVEVLEDPAKSQVLKRSAWAVFARPGDLFHPSLSVTVSEAAAREKPDLVVFNDILVSSQGKAAEFIYRPNHEPTTLRHMNGIGLSFAARPAILEGYPHDLVGHLIKGAHPFLLHLAETTLSRWKTIPEFLAARREVAPASPLKELSGIYREILGRDEHFDFREESAGATPYRLSPKRRAKSISVIIPFKDRPDMTARCLESIAAQKAGAKIDVVMVDNGSKPASVEKVRKAAAAGGLRAAIVSDPRPFNHSRQTTMGTRSATGEVFVFLNNDAVLKSPTALDELAAWALAPNVGTAGCRILDPHGRLVSAGVRAQPGHVYQESEEESASRFVRETFANSFACAAVSRRVLERVGPLDEIGFPNGYNDVEFCLRARTQGLRHVYLGHLEIEHVPSSTRAPSDESRQRLELRLRFPQFSTDSLLQLSRRPVRPWLTKVSKLLSGAFR